MFAFRHTCMSTMNRICRDSISSLMWISWKSESKSVASFKLISCCIFNWKFAGWNPYFSKVCWTFFTLRCSFQISKVDRGVATEASLILCIDAQSLKLKGMTPMIDILVPVAWWQEIYLSTIQINTFGLITVGIISDHFLSWCLMLLVQCPPCDWALSSCKCVYS